MRQGTSEETGEWPGPRCARALAVACSLLLAIGAAAALASDHDRAAAGPRPVLQQRSRTSLIASRVASGSEVRLQYRARPRPGEPRTSPLTVSPRHSSPVPGSQGRTSATAILRDAGEPTPAQVPSAPSGWRIGEVPLEVGNQARYYLVARPSTVTAGSLPVLVVLHGRNMTPAAIERLSGFLDVVGQAVVVYPAGYGESWNAGYCCGVAHTAGVDDVAFLESVVKSVLASQPGTSPSRVYLVGFSNGGRMAYDMACSDPGAFAGVASVEAVAVSSCDSAPPLPVLEIASTGDPLLALGDTQPPKTIAGHVEVTVDELMAHWRSLDGCTTPAHETTYPSLTVTEWPDCAGRGRIGLAVYQGGHHDWPSGSPTEPSAEQLVWSFFEGEPAITAPEAGGSLELSASPGAHLPSATR